jgi:acyl transferase domain-containing protein
MGLSSADHPLLGAATPLADSDGFLLTGRLSSTEAGWLKDHAVFGTVLLPGTGLLELSFAAARAVGLTTVSQLTLVSPLVLPPEVAVRVQVQLDGPEEEGRRGLSIYSRAEDAPAEASWTLHAQSVLSSVQEDAEDAKGIEASGMEAIGMEAIGIEASGMDWRADAVGEAPGLWAVVSGVCEACVLAMWCTAEPGAGGGADGSAGGWAASGAAGQCAACSGF